MSSWRRTLARRLGVPVCVSLVVAAVGCVDEPPLADQMPAPDPAPEAAPRAVDISVRDVRGTVEIGRDGSWSPATIGARLAASEAIRTSASGAARLSVGDEAEVRVDGASEVTVGEISSTVSRLQLERGRLHATVESERFTLQVQAKDNETIAEARSGAFSVFTDGAGLVAVATTRGGVKLRAPGHEVALAAGQRAEITPMAPAKVSPIPESILLKVEWPDQKTTGASSVTLRGRVELGTAVAINGETAAVAADGQFAVQVALRDGRNDIQVSAKDLSGRVATRAGVVEAIHRAPKVKVKSEKLWE